LEVAKSCLPARVEVGWAAERARSACLCVARCSGFGLVGQLRQWAPQGSSRSRSHATPGSGARRRRSQKATGRAAGCNAGTLRPLLPAGLSPRVAPTPDPGCASTRRSAWPRVRAPAGPDQRAQGRSDVAAAWAPATRPESRAHVSGEVVPAVVEIHGGCAS